MKTNVKDTSKKAYKKIIKSLPEKRRDVYGAIKKLKTCCDVDIAEYLEWTINRVTGRRNELEKLGLVESIGKRMTRHSDIAVYHWQIVKP